MSPVNGVGYKVDVVSSGSSTSDVGGQVTDPTSSVDSLFEQPTTQGSQLTGNSDPIDDYTVGEYSGGTATGGDDAFTTWLRTFPPSPAEVFAQNENVQLYPDLLLQRYQKAGQDLQLMQQTLQADLSSGTLTSAETQKETTDLALVKQALAKCSAAEQEVTKLMDSQENIYHQEQCACKDLNNDGSIGRPGVKGSYWVKEKADGTLVYIDPISKQAVPAPVVDANEQPKISEKGLNIVDASAVTKPTDGSDDPCDLTLQLDESALDDASNGHYLGSTINLDAPEHFWVERDPNGTGDNIYKLNYDANNSEEKMVLYNQWDSSDGIRQKVPPDLSKYTQVEVTRMVVRSVPVGAVDGASDANAQVYDHIVEYYNGENLISRMRVAGVAPTQHPDHPHPSATMVNGQAYIAASSVSMAITGPERGSPIQIDASGMMSTCRKVVDPATLESTLGISKPGDARGDQAYNENIGEFTDKDFTTKKWDADSKKWVDGTDMGFTSGANAYGDWNERYMPPSMTPAPDSPYSTFNTGLAISGVRGDITGTRYNDIIATSGVNEQSDYAKAHTPKKDAKITNTDPFYNNFVDAGGGNDMVIAGRGDNYIRNASFVWVKDGGSQDRNFISMVKPSTNVTGLPDGAIAPNQKNFVHIQGGQSKIFNPDEMNVKNSDGNTPTDTTKNDDSYLDDYYQVVGGSAQYGNPDDPDVKNSPSGSTGGDTFDDNFISDAMTDPHGKWYDALTAVPDVSQEDQQYATNADVGKAEQDLTNETNSFFDQWFSEADQFASEKGFSNLSTSGSTSTTSTSGL